MLRKIVTGVLAALVLFAAPAAILQPAALAHPQLWLLVAIGVFASVTQPVYRPIDRAAPSEDRNTATQIVWSVYLSQIGGVAESVTFRYPQSLIWDSVTWLGLVMAIGGASFRWWAVATLGKYFTWHVSVRADQQVVTSGPYKIVRHPSYTGAIVLYVGTLVFIKAWIMAAVAFALMLLAFGRRIQHEEDALSSSLAGDVYKNYCSRVKRLVPLLW